ncbi:hypothetical protein [Colwellia sp. KU-HH00111]|uniref:hypothetical protein n=1 Tax=Colwellia sp. KU-HH00111 TaxID=3127652 RepID=UPI003365AAF3
MLYLIIRFSGVGRFTDVVSTLHVISVHSRQSILLTFIPLVLPVATGAPPFF